MDHHRPRAAPAGFGATGAQVDAVAAKDWSSYLDAALAADPEADPGALATPMPTCPPSAARVRAPAVTDRKEFNRRLSEQMTELSQWWFRRMVAVQQPMHEKLTLLWHNHFATSAQKVRVAAYMAAQNQKLRSLSARRFPHALAYAMLTDAAMLRWLDGQSNTAKAANENLAREFMELFALGHGNGYTEDDVREGARALTGWVIRPDGADAVRAQASRPHGQRRCSASPANFDAAGILRRRAGPAEIGARTSPDGCGSSWPPTPRRRRRRSTASSPPTAPRRDLKALTRVDPHRRRIPRQPGSHRQHAGRVACRGDPDAAGSRRQPGAAEDGQHHAAGAGSAAVLPTRRRRMAARPGLDVDGQRRRADARRKSIGASG